MNNPNLMNVEIDGKIEQRPVDHVVVHKSTALGPSTRVLPMRCIPVLRDDEQALWTVGSDVPVIVKVAR